MILNQPALMPMNIIIREPNSYYRMFKQLHLNRFGLITQKMLFACWLVVLLVNRFPPTTKVETPAVIKNGHYYMLLPV
ncbi:hypothetical protein A7P93_00710 [Eikenella corrodens]|nr:hypothetical protein A7P93_00710 [Eikenella corrodens]